MPQQKITMFSGHLFFLVLAMQISTIAICQKAVQDVTQTMNATFSCKKVEVPARFSEGVWNSYFEKKLQTDVPKLNEAPMGVYNVIVLFVIDKYGCIERVKPITNLGYGMEEEVIRIIETSPNWIPATQNGRIVKEYRRQTATFIVSDLLFACQNWNTHK